MPRKCAYGGRLFASVLPDWHCELDPRLRRKSGCSAIAAPVASSNHHIGGQAAHSRDIRHDQPPCSTAWKLGDISSLPCRVSGTGEGTRSLSIASFVIDSRPPHGVCDIRQVQHLQQPHSLRYIVGDDMASAEVSIPAVSCIAGDIPCR